uniref:2-phosphoglycerate kinase n=1 Tax=Brachypodium distachyon TaxID=15368 RepID=C3SAC6_BRADI|nr:2-phosphoglycerate kinase [Brachypodium distachyon]
MTQDQAGLASGSGDPETPPERAAGEGASSSAAGRLPSRNASSKYDFVKVKVWLGENADHYYVLSRFLLSRMLTVTKIPNHVAIKIALELKKLLVDNSLLDVSQSDLEANLFKLMEKRGYGEDYISRYKMMTRQTWSMSCCGHQQSLAGDLKKAMKDGKPIIIEGIHLDPSIYLMDEENADANSRMEKKAESDNSAVSVENKIEHQFENGLSENRISVTNEDIAEGHKFKPEESRTNEGLSGADSHGISSSEARDSKEKNPKAEGMSSYTGNGHKDLDQQKNTTTKKDKPAAEPIIVPIVLRMSDFDHKALLEEWIATRALRDNCLPQDHRKLINNLKLIQDYLCSFESQGLTVVDISANSFPQTLDWLHGYLLQIFRALVGFRWLFMYLESWQHQKSL